jgi:hypothetical protein
LKVYVCYTAYGDDVEQVVDSEIKAKTWQVSLHEELRADGWDEEDLKGVFYREFELK